MSIPKKIHQIWIGESEIPKSWQIDCEEIKNRHDDWEYIFWDNQKVDLELKKMPENVKEKYKYFFNEKQWAYASDILRYWIIYKYGGVYLDCDFKMTKKGSLNTLPLEKDLILVNMRAIHKGKKFKCRIQNCFLAAKKKQNFLKRIVEKISNLNYKLKTIRGDETEKYSCGYLTTEYSFYVQSSDTKKHKNSFRKKIKKMMPKEECILNKEYFLGDKPIIAKHLAKRSHGLKLTNIF